MQLHHIQQTPARLNKLTTYQLPRWLLIVLAFAYMFAGLFFRDAWKNDDSLGIATAVSLYQQDTPSWLLTYVGHHIYPQEGPLSSWLGWLLITLFSPLFGLFTDPTEAAILSVRLGNFLYVFTLLWFVRKATKILAERRECRPLKLPFGGEPALIEYSRTLADCAFLFLLANVGIIVHLHLTGPVALVLACNAIGFYGLTRLFARPRSAALFIAAGLAGTFLTRGVIGAAPLMLSCLCCLLYPQLNFKRKVLIGGCLIAALALCGAWVLAAWQENQYWTQQWLSWNLNAYTWHFFPHVLGVMRDWCWFLWPAWPFALLAVWNWRGWLKAPHIFMPLMFFAANFLNIIFISDSFENEYAPIVIASSVLASMAIPTIRRDIINALDWFSIMVISLTMISIWFVWIAYQTGFPADLHHHIDRLLTGFEDRTHIATIFIALLATICWVMLIFWRLKLSPKAIWRGVALAACGLTCAWVLFMSLWLSAFNYHRSYKGLAEDLLNAYAQHRQAGDCLQALGLGEGQRALFFLYGRIEFADEHRYCNWILVQSRLDRIHELEAQLPANTLYWADNRDSDRHGEIFQLRRLQLSK